LFTAVASVAASDRVVELAEALGDDEPVGPVGPEFECSFTTVTVAAIAATATTAPMISAGDRRDRPAGGWLGVVGQPLPG
jgi:hypothetical protein